MRLNFKVLQSLKISCSANTHTAQYAFILKGASLLVGTWMFCFVVFLQQCVLICASVCMLVALHVWFDEKWEKF